MQSDLCVGTNSGGGWVCGDGEAGHGRGEGADDLDGASGFGRRGPGALER